jgi:hypothetical protein
VAGVARAIVESTRQHLEHDRAQPSALAECAKQPMLERSELRNPDRAKRNLRKALERRIRMPSDECWWSRAAQCHVEQQHRAHKECPQQLEPRGLDAVYRTASLPQPFAQGC